MNARGMGGKMKNLKNWINFIFAWIDFIFAWIDLFFALFFLCFVAFIMFCSDKIKNLIANKK
jgi:ABC-type multidrug transport system permease subunit